jgi:hypothetical protein
MKINVGRKNNIHHEAAEDTGEQQKNIWLKI